MLVYGGMAVFLLLGVFWAAWSMAVWCLFYILKSSWPLLLQVFFFCSIHLSFFFWCTNYSCITSFDIIPHLLNDLFCFIYHDYLFIYFLHTLVWEVSVVLSSSLLIFSLGYLKFIDETMKAFFIVAIVFLISTISFRFSLSISISFVCCLLFFH